MSNQNNTRVSRLPNEQAAVDKAVEILGCPELPYQPFKAALRAYEICYPGSGAKGWRDLKEWLITESGSQLPYFRKLAEICRRAFGRHGVRNDDLKQIAFGIYFFDLVVQIITGDYDGEHAVTV